MDPRDRVAVGETGLVVSRLGMGTGPLGKYDDDATWSAIFETAWQAGVRLFDTSPFYGFGRSERMLGRQLARRNRDEFVLETKVGRLIRNEGPLEPFAQAYFYPNGVPDNAPRGQYDYSEAGARQSLAESYERLGVDRIDVVHVHDIIELSSGVDHREQVIAETIPFLVGEREAGRIRAVGIGVQVNDLLTDIATRADIDMCLLAGRYTLLDQSALEEALPTCVERGVSVVIGSPYNTGILHNPGPNSTFDFVQAPPERIERALALKAACERHGVPLPAASIQFPFGHPAVVAVLTGAEKAAELAENAALMRFDIPEALWHELRDTGLIDPAAPLPCERLATTH